MPGNNKESEELVCAFCGARVREEDNYCPECGILFSEDVYCENHPKIPAEGVCIICGLPYCKACGYRVNKLFLCSLHGEGEKS